MIARISIMDMKNGDEGILQYDRDYEKAQPVIWGLYEGPVELREKLQKYFTTKRTFQIPDSGEIDDFREETAKPIESTTYFELALSQMFYKTGVKLIKALNTREES